jgi:hypothetical protein
MASSKTTQEQNRKALAALQREYPTRFWSCSTHDEDPDEIVVTFQRYSDDAEDRYVIRDGSATLI